MIVTPSQTRTASPSDAMLIALEVDGTIVPGRDIHVPPVTAAAIQDAVAAGHHVALTSRRDLTDILSVAASAQMDSGWMITSDGVVTARIRPEAPGRYEVDDAGTETFDVKPLLDLIDQVADDTMIAIEEVGYGYHATDRLEHRDLPGRLSVVPRGDLPEVTTRAVLQCMPAVTDDLAHVIRLSGLTVCTRSTTCLVVAPPASTAAALGRLQNQLGIARGNTIAVGSTRDSVPVFAWAATAISMGQAPAVVHAAADGATAPLEQDGVAFILEGILAHVRTTTPELRG